MMDDKYIFIDRDGVINYDGERITEHWYITKWEDFTFIPGVLDAFKLAHENGYKCIIVSNQQCVGKGIVSPKELGELTNCRYLYLSSNMLWGSIPVQLGKLSLLSVLALSYNQLTGDIPAVLVDLQHLDEVTLAHNAFKGPPPSPRFALHNQRAEPEL